MNLIRSLLLTPLTLLALLALSLSAHANSVVLQNKWKNSYFAYSDGAFADAPSPADPGARWILEPVGYDNYFRLRSEATGGYLHLEQGPPQVGPVEPGWWSAMWVLGPVDGQFVRLQNRWKPNQYIHNEYGPPVAGPIEPGWWSAQWSVQQAPAMQVGGGQVYSAFPQQPQQPPAVATQQPQPPAVAMQQPQQQQPADAAPQSQQGQPVVLVIQNASRVPVDVYVDVAPNDPRWLSTLEAGYQLEQPTQSGTVWRLGTENPDAWVATYGVTDAPQQTLRYPQ